MTNKQLIECLVDIYAGSEMSSELENQFAELSAKDQELASEATSLRATVAALQASQPAEFTEESYQRVLLKLYARGVEVQKQLPDPMHLQYQLPIQG